MNRNRNQDHLRAKTATATNCFSAFQWKYDVDEGSPWWKKMYFRYVWLPLARFSYFKVKIVPFNRLEPDGTLSWKENQGTFEREEDAEREAARYRYGGYDVVAFNSPECAQTITERSHFPASDAWLEYERQATEADIAASHKLQQVLTETQHVVDKWRSRHA